MARVRLSARIHGDVQGVGFRAFTRNHAWRLGLRGYVRNVVDGTVEVVAEGEREALQTFLSILNDGPRYGRVSRVDAEWAEATEEFRDFGVRF